MPVWVPWYPYGQLGTHMGTLVPIWAPRYLYRYLGAYIGTRVPIGTLGTYIGT